MCAPRKSRTWHLPPQELWKSVDLIGRLTYFAEISKRMYEEIRSSRDPRDHVVVLVEDG